MERARGKQAGAGGQQGRKKAVRNLNFNARREAQEEEEAGSEESGFESEEEVIDRKKDAGKVEKRTAPTTAASVPLKGILKKPASSVPSTTASNAEGVPAAPVSKPSRAARDKFAEDDAEIAALEKLLGVKGKKKLPKSFADDGLDDLLGGLEGDESDEGDGAESRKRKREDEEWLGRRRRLIQSEDLEEESGGESGSSDEGTGAETEDDVDLNEEEEGDWEEDALSESTFSGFDSEPPSQPEIPTRVRENPYVAPVAPSEAKYIPPSLRAAPASETESLSRLRRQTLGLLNRLSETNLTSILTDIEKLYATNPRQHVTSTLCTLLLDLICDRTTLSDPFIILHGGFITAIYRLIGPDFAAEILSQVVSRFDTLFPNPDTTLTTDKSAINLISLLSALYTLTLTTSHLLFAYIRQFLTTLTEPHTELLLKILRSSGPQLRHSDPSALKSIVLLLQPAIASAGGETTLSVRTKFMIETITALKNNRMKTGAAASAITSEHTTRMKKILGSLNDGKRTIRGTEPLNLSLEDLRSTDKRGKWWLVGSSWHPQADSQPEPSSLPTNTQPRPSPSPDADTSISIPALAHQNHMSTPTRQLLFTTLLSAPDYPRAATTLLSLPLKKSTFRTETPRVLLACVGGEEVYNPYYALVTTRLVELDRRLRMNLNFALWDFLKRLGEDEEGDGSGVGLRKVVNTAKCISELALRRTLDIGDVLRPIEDLRYLARGGQTYTFVEVLLVSVISDACKKEKEKGTSKNKEGDRAKSEIILSNIFAIKDPGLRAGLSWFVEKVVRKSDLISSKKKEKERIVSGCRAVLAALARGEGDGNYEGEMEDRDDSGIEDEREGGFSN